MYSDLASRTLIITKLVKLEFVAEEELTLKT